MGKKTVEYKVKRAWRVVFKYPRSLQVFCRSLGRFDICECKDGIWEPSGKTVNTRDLAVAAKVAQQFGATVLVDHEFHLPAVFIY